VVLCAEVNDAGHVAALHGQHATDKMLWWKIVHDSGGLFVSVSTTDTEAMFTGCWGSFFASAITDSAMALC